MTKGAIVVDAGRRRGLVVLGLAVLAAHAVLLGAFDEAAAPGAGAPAAAPVLRVRAVVAPRPVDIAAPEPPVPVSPAPPRRVPAAPRAQPVSQAPAPAPAPAAVAAAMPDAEETTAPAVATTAAESPAAMPTPADPAPELPTYPTQLPPAVTLAYDLQRGHLAGQGELRWRSDGERYTLELEGRIAGVALLTQRSQGGVDAAGLAPERFTDRRIRRAAQAANFDRASERITFSGPSFVLPLRAGVQDRLAWMVQLAGIVAADPQRAEVDATTVLQVVGARGDAGLWVFRSAGRETLETAAGRIEAQRFVREPRGPYDTGVEVWLDPARHHLPVRAMLRNGGDGEALELRLRAQTEGG